MENYFWVLGAVVVLFSGCAESAQQVGTQVDGAVAAILESLPSFEDVAKEVPGAVTIAPDAKIKQATINLGVTGCDVTRINAPFQARLVLELKASGGQQTFRTDDGDESTAEINTVVNDGGTRNVSLYLRRPEVTYSSGLLCHGTIVAYKPETFVAPPAPDTNTEAS